MIYKNNYRNKIIIYQCNYKNKISIKICTPKYYIYIYIYIYIYYFIYNYKRCWINLCLLRNLITNLGNGEREIKRYKNMVIKKER